MTLIISISVCLPLNILINSDNASKFSLGSNSSCLGHQTFDHRGWYGAIQVLRNADGGGGGWEKSVTKV